MGIIKQGILGGFSGTVGTVVGAQWRGITYMRGKSTSKRHGSSFKQEEQQMRFVLMVKFMRKMSVFVNRGYHNLAIRMTPLNAGLSYNLKNSITGDFPNYEVAYNMVLLSRGDLPNAQNPQAAAGTGSTVEFTWVNNAGSGKALATDLCLVTAYCPEKDLAVCSRFGNEFTREDQHLILEVPQFAGLEVETYISFFSQNGKEIADSIYTGMVTIT